MLFLCELDRILLLEEVVVISSNPQFPVAMAAPAAAGELGTFSVTMLVPGLRPQLPVFRRTTLTFTLILTDFSIEDNFYAVWDRP